MSIPSPLTVPPPPVYAARWKGGPLKRFFFFLGLRLPSEGTQTFLQFIREQASFL